MSWRLRRNWGILSWLKHLSSFKNVHDNLNDGNIQTYEENFAVLHFSIETNRFDLYLVGGVRLKTVQWKLPGIGAHIQRKSRRI